MSSCEMMQRINGEDAKPEEQEDAKTFCLEPSLKFLSLEKRLSTFNGVNMSKILPAKRQKCEVTSIENLPDEVIHEIFTVLDNKTLKNCAIVNKR